MLKGVFPATKKDGTIYYRTSINYSGKHISLGSFASEEMAHLAYKEASQTLSDAVITIDNVYSHKNILPHEKIIILLNFRDNGLYFKNPIYLRKGYFSYFLSEHEELKFDIDDPFYYSSHKIQKRQGHLFVSDYGMQYSILSRYGIRPYAVAGRDYQFVNGDSYDYRYANILVINRFHGVLRHIVKGITKYRTMIHINGNYLVGTYSSEEKAAVAYNKAVDLAKAAGIKKDFPENYVDTLPPKEYAEVYTKVKLSERYLSYLEEFSNSPA